MNWAKGLTLEQQSLLEERNCSNGHRFNGMNFPTPDGDCLLCVDPDFAEKINQAQLLTLVASDSVNDNPLPTGIAVTTGESAIPLVLTQAPKSLRRQRLERHISIHRQRRVRQYQFHRTTR